MPFPHNPPGAYFVGIEPPEGTPVAGRQLPPGVRGLAMLRTLAEAAEAAVEGGAAEARVDVTHPEGAAPVLVDDVVALGTPAPVAPEAPPPSSGRVVAVDLPARAPEVAAVVWGRDPFGTWGMFPVDAPAPASLSVAALPEAPTLTVATEAPTLTDDAGDAGEER